MVRTPSLLPRIETRPSYSRLCRRFLAVFPLNRSFTIASHLARADVFEYRVSGSAPLAPAGGASFVSGATKKQLGEGTKNLVGTPSHAVGCS